MVQLSLFAFMRSRRRWRTISYAKISHALLYASPMRNSCTIVNTFIPPEYRDLNADTLGVVVLIFNIVCIACHLLIDLISIHRLLRGISRFACRYSHILGLATNVSRDNSRLLFFSVTLQTPTVAILRCRVPFCLRRNKGSSPNLMIVYAGVTCGLSLDDSPQ